MNDIVFINKTVVTTATVAIPTTSMFYKNHKKRGLNRDFIVDAWVKENYPLPTVVNISSVRLELFNHKEHLMFDIQAIEQ